MNALLPERRFLTVTLAALALALALTACGSDDDDAVDPVPTPATVVPIAEARAQAEGSTAVVEGYVTSAPGTFNSATGELGFGVQDDTGGIYVTMTRAATAVLGAKVRVEGKVGQTAKLTVLAAEPAAVTVESGSKEITPKDVKTGEVNEANEGLLVRVNGKITQPVGDDAPYGFKVFLDDGSGEIQVFVHLVDMAPVIDSASLLPDQEIEVTGFAGQYEATYEVMPRKADDLVKK